MFCEELRGVRTESARSIQFHRTVKVFSTFRRYDIKNRQEPNYGEVPITANSTKK